ncbi:hypothetical protein ACFO4E_03205 [Nocardiopsis mangrovi]|uniref:DUF3592 domain-containing protein n=1 Tax=Nocardiopsis mangrovi TaxID=1179818 RepID=A0ABV9DQ18_9ACTN
MAVDPAPPRVDPARLRPVRAWYGIGAAIAVCGLIAGAMGFVIGLLNSESLPHFRAQFGDDETAIVDFDHANQGTHAWLIYTDRYTTDDEIAAFCTIDGPRGPVTVSPAHDQHSDGWFLAGRIDAAEAGDHTLRCHSGEGLRYAVGFGNDAHGVSTGVLWTVAAAFAPAVAGVLIGAAVLILTAVLRARDGRRVLAGGQPRDGARRRGGRVP